MMKMKLNLLSDESKELLNLLHGKFLTKEPKDKSDLAFCRGYILYQRWKTIRRSEDWEKMDEVVYKLYDRTPDSVKNSDVLKQILLPQNNSILDTLIHISGSSVIILDEYFKYIKNMNLEDDCVILPEIGDIEINDLSDLIDDNESREFHLAYNSFVQSLTAVSEESKEAISNSATSIKVEDDDDDCQIISVNTENSEATDLIHEILDDDDIEIIYFKKKQQQKNQKERKDSVSFLDSIDISEPVEGPTEKVSSSTSIPHPIQVASASNLVSTSTNVPLSEQNSTNCDEGHSIRDILSSECSNTESHIENENKIVNMEVDNDVSIKVKIPHSGLILDKMIKNTETQTDDPNLVDRAGKQDNCHNSKTDTESHHTFEKQEHPCRNYYFELVTSPSDLPSHKHVTPITDTSVYPNVYANVVNACSSQDKIDDNEKVLASSNSVTSAEEVQKLCVPQTMETDSLEPSALEQGTHSDRENQKEDQYGLRNEVSNTCYKVEPVLDLDARRGKEPNLEESLQLEDARLNAGDSIREKVVNSQKTDVDSTDNRVTEEIDVNNASPHSYDSNLVSASSTEEISENKALAQNSSPDTYSSTVMTPNCEDVISSHNFKSNNATGACDLSPRTHCIASTTSINSPTSNDIASNIKSKTAILPCASPDTTSTSADIQDFDKNINSVADGFDERHAPRDNISETEEFSNAENYSHVGYIAYAKCNGNAKDGVDSENVSQSNIEDGEEEEIFIEENVLLNNEEELSFIIGEALPIGANVNITMESQYEESLTNSNASSPTNDLENGQPEDSRIDEGGDPVIPEQGALEEKDRDPVAPCKELKVAAEKMPVSNEVKLEKNTATNQRKIMYTSSEKVQKHPVDAFSKFEESIQLHWSKIKHNYGWEEIFSGPISKMNGVNSCVNPDKNFDLFNPKPSIVAEEHAGTNSSANSSGDVISPPYEGIDDFRSYYEESRNNNMLGSPSPPKLAPNISPLAEKSYLKDNTNRLAGQIFARDLQTLQNGANLYKVPGEPLPLIPDRERTPKPKPTQNSVKRMRIAFAKNIVDASNAVSHAPTDSPLVLQSILKKPTLNGESFKQVGQRTMRPRIPRHLMNLKSLARFKVMPNDPCLQGVPCVVVEKLSDSELDQWHRMSKLAYEVQQLKKQWQNAKFNLEQFDYKKAAWTKVCTQMTNLTQRRRMARGKDKVCTQMTNLTQREKNGKRKRQNTVSFNSPNLKKRPVFRKTPEKSLENSTRKTSRKRKKPEKDYKMLINSGGYSFRPF
ncbi:hypothetical protein NQ318_008207 [Aromia moschata]|uniref:Uncharacterized protein n=1 Tax=Aromia moschata TaxID=1265417 RepID=A0AAV8YL73_9CUCU|nr:hypothetical protein NQ318_008207 [Aromia moschata]